MTKLSNITPNELSFSSFHYGTEFYLVDDKIPLVLTENGWFSFVDGTPKRYSKSMLLTANIDLSKCDFARWMQALKGIKANDRMVA